MIFGPLLAMFGVGLVGYGSTSFSPQVEQSTSHLSIFFLSTSPDCGECGKCSPGLCRAQGLWSDGQLTRGHAGLRSTLTFLLLFLAIFDILAIVCCTMYSAKCAGAGGEKCSAGSRPCHQLLVQLPQVDLHWWVLLNFG